jgi:endonuclease-3
LWRRNEKEQRQSAKHKRKVHVEEHSSNTGHVGKHADKRFVRVRAPHLQTRLSASDNAPMTVRERVAKLVKAWPKVYPNAHCELNFRNPLELLVATILSAQCTDKRVNMVTPALFKKYRTAKDYANAPQAEFENAIRSTGFYRSKTKSIRGAMRAIAEEHGGKVPDTMEELNALPGVGRKTANVVLGNAFHKNAGIVVDTHVIRLSQRLGLTKHKDAEKIERDLMKLVPREHWTGWSHWLIWHGRRRCYARKPDCSNCEVFPLCPSGKVFLRTGQVRSVAN